jgi:hypothetical protein
MHISRQLKIEFVVPIPGQASPSSRARVIDIVFLNSAGTQLNFGVYRSQ